MIKNGLKKIYIALVLLMLVSLNIVPAYSAAYFDFYPAKDINNKTITLTGDSYAGYFATFECHKDYNILIYAEAGKSTKENYEIMKTAVGLYPDTIVISVGVNDHNKNETPEGFRERLDEILSLCKRYGKKVILHTYMSYDVQEFADKKHEYDVKDYDEILKDLGKKYSNAFYIDMSDYNNKEFWQNDKIHYNIIFYDELYNRISTALMLF